MVFSIFFWYNLIMKKFKLQISIITLFLILACAYYLMPDGIILVDSIFLSLATFLFAVFTGFFISRQGVRYNEIRKLMANFDGIMSSFYRAIGHFGKKSQDKAGIIIVAHYKPIVETGEWDYSFTHKTSTLVDLNLLLNETVKNKGLDGIKGPATTGILLGLNNAQLVRKNMVSLREERIPEFQLFLIYAITIVLFFAVSAIDSENLILGSLIKSAFISSVLAVIVILKKLDKLQLFEGGIGKHSAEDVINIIEGKK
jgi:hypothetical protein